MGRCELLLSPAYEVLGKVIIWQVSVCLCVCSQGVPTLAEGYLPWLGGYQLWRRCLTWLEALPLLGCYLAWTEMRKLASVGTYHGRRVPTLDGGGYLPWTDCAAGVTPLMASRRRTFLLRDGFISLWKARLLNVKDISRLCRWRNWTSCRSGSCRMSTPWLPLCRMDEWRNRATSKQKYIYAGRGRGLLKHTSVRSDLFDLIFCISICI